MSLQITDDDFTVIKMVAGLNKLNYPPTPDILEKSRPLIHRGIVVLEANGNLTITNEAKFELLATGRQF